MSNKELIKTVQELIKRVEELESKETEPTKPLYSIPEVAKVLGVTKEAVYCMIKRGEIPAVKIGTMKVRASDICNLIGARTVNG